MGATEIVAFLSWLAIEKQVSASTQNQALSAVLFLYKQVFRLDLGPIEHVPRARMPDKLPVVLSREEIGQLMKHVDGTMWLIVALLYGTGVRLQECMELRVKDVDFDRDQIIIRRGKRQKDRVTMLPAGVKERLTAQPSAFLKRIGSWAPGGRGSISIQKDECLTSACSRRRPMQALVPSRLKPDVSQTKLGWKSTQ